ncbi:MAG: PaaI family thioesterase [Acetobacteraceae bacterium]
MTLFEKLNALSLPFATLMGVVYTTVEPEKVVATLLVREDLCTAGHVIHGGAVMALADTLGAAGTFINLPPDAKGTATIESKTNFIAPAPAGSTVTATATPIHRGRRTQVWQTRVETDAGRLVAIVTQTQMVL